MTPEKSNNTDREDLQNAIRVLQDAMFAEKEEDRIAQPMMNRAAIVCSVTLMLLAREESDEERKRELVYGSEYVASGTILFHAVGMARPCGVAVRDFVIRYMDKCGVDIDEALDHLQYDLDVVWW